MKQMTILFITLFSIGCGSNSEPVTVEDATAFAATVYTFAVLTPDDEAIDNDRTPNPTPNECECNGTRQIRHGDGHVTECPCGGSCRCSSSGMAPTSSEEPEAFSEPSEASDGMVTIQPVTESKPRTRLLVFSATWCGPCQVMKSELNVLKNNGWNVDVSDTASIQIIDFDQHQDIAQKYGVTRLPTTVRLVDDSVTHSYTGPMDRWQIDNFYRKGN